MLRSLFVAAYPDDGVVPEHVLTELAAREPLFHRAEQGTSKADFDAMMHPDFWEIGASGRCYSREHVLDVLAQRYRDEAPSEEWTIRAFTVQSVAPSVYLASYTLDYLHRTTRRSTLWENSAGVWTARFHQGTVVS